MRPDVTKMSDLVDRVARESVPCASRVYRDVMTGAGLVLASTFAPDTWVLC